LDFSMSDYDILFEPVKIGPVTAKNRFYQVPHCNGMGYRDPSAQASMRKIKAEGGWAVVCTEQVEIHATSDIAPFIELRIWDDQDIPALKRICDAIHSGGGLAGIELAHNGMNAPNQLSREIPLGPSHLPVAPDTIAPVQARAMSKQDIDDLRRWHRNAVRRSLDIGFDVIYVYGAHGYGAPHHFLSKRYNTRTDEYGGSLKNRMRLLKELLTDTISEVAGRAAIACRITVEEEVDGGITREDIEGVLSELGELPDLWDFAMGSWEGDSMTSRFAGEGRQEEFVVGLKKLTSKPVVGDARPAARCSGVSGSFRLDLHAGIHRPDPGPGHGRSRQEPDGCRRLHGRDQDRLLGVRRRPTRDAPDRRAAVHLHAASPGRGLDDRLGPRSSDGRRRRLVPEVLRKVPPPAGDAGPSESAVRDRGHGVLRPRHAPHVGKRGSDLRRRAHDGDHHVAAQLLDHPADCVETPANPLGGRATLPGAWRSASGSFLPS
jgi:2,4-dienoyl-CoA reductase-like NADH-dependent reductase (Old Yellow Enzyme family)